MNTPVLEVTNLSKNFGGLRALNEVDLTINRQEIVALIGPNGAGKTTFFNCITGIYLPTEGTVQLHLPERNGKPASSTTLNGMKPNEITSLGMARTFQNIRLFKELYDPVRPGEALFTLYGKEGADMMALARQVADHIIVTAEQAPVQEPVISEIIV